MMNEAVNTIMSTDLITVRPAQKLDEVRYLFLTHHIHHLPVVNDHSQLIGIITTYDLWKNEIAPVDYNKTEVVDIMTTSVARIGPYDKIGTAAEIFLDNRFHALPVVDENDALLGIVTSFDVLLYEFKKEYPKPILFKHLFGGDPAETTRISA